MRFPKGYCCLRDGPEEDGPEKDGPGRDGPERDQGAWCQKVAPPTREAHLRGGAMEDVHQRMRGFSEKGAREWGQGLCGKGEMKEAGEEEVDVDGLVDALGEGHAGTVAGANFDADEGGVFERGGLG